MKNRCRHYILAFLTFFFVAAAASAETVYLTQEEFTTQAFDGESPKSEVLWLQKALQDDIKAILGHPYHKLRVRYWQQQPRSAWILEEIGKEQYITAGFVVKAGAIESIDILVYRESRGWEVRHAFFTNQFKGIELNEDNELNTHIDGITGATLSVNALKRLAHLALYLHEQVMANRNP